MLIDIKLIACFAASTALTACGNEEENKSRLTFLMRSNIPRSAPHPPVQVIDGIPTFATEGDHDHFPLQMANAASDKQIEQEARIDFCSMLTYSDSVLTYASAQTVTSARPDIYFSSDGGDHCDLDIPTKHAVVYQHCQPIKKLHNQI